MAPRWSTTCGDNFARWGTGAVEGFVDDPETPPDQSLYNQGASASIGTPAVDRYRQIVVALGTTVDETEIAALVREAEQLLADELVFIPLFVRDFQAVTRTNRISAPAEEVAGGLRPPFFQSYRADLGDQARYDR